MTARQIHDMDIVTHARAINRIIITTKDRQLRQFTHRHLADVWHQIIGDITWIFADKSTIMRPDWIKVA